MPASPNVGTLLYFICICYFAEQHITIKTSTIIAIINKTGWVNTVSYTHLDVYKRQPFRKTLSALPIFSVLIHCIIYTICIIAVCVISVIVIIAIHIDIIIAIIIRVICTLLYRCTFLCTTAI